MRPEEILDEMKIYECPECHCCTGDDWEFKDFSCNNIIICPQCKNEIDVE